MINNDEYKHIHLNYAAALEYFVTDVDMLEWLKELNEEEIKDFHMIVIINHKEKSASYYIGGYNGVGRLEVLNDKIDNTSNHEDDYDGVIEFLKENKLYNLLE